MENSNYERIRQSWSLVIADPSRAGNVFYANLFRIDETAKPMFVGDIELQGRKLMETLGFIVDHLDDPDVLMPAAGDLARAHVAYGVTAEQYDSVGTALIQTLKQLLGSSFGSDDERAWTEVYSGLADHMKKEAYG